RAAVRPPNAALPPPRRFGFLALDLLGKRALATADSLVELVQRATALSRVPVKVGVSFCDRLFDRTRDLVAQTHEARALLLALCFEALCVGGDACLCVGDELPLSLLQLFQLRRHDALRPIQILGPGTEARVELALVRSQRLRERRVRGSLVLGFGPTPLFRDAPFLLRQERDGVGPRAGERPLELCGALCRLLLDQLLQPM